MTIAWILIFLFVLAAAVTMGWGAVSAAPFLPAGGRDARRMVALADIQPGQRVYDLGAGDGRLVIEAARRYGAQAIGFEVSILPYLIGRLRLLRRPRSGSARLVWRDFFRWPLHDANAVFCFLTPRAMVRLDQKFRRELKSGARVVSLAFALPNWQPVRIDRPTPQSFKIYVYEVGKS